MFFHQAFSVIVVQIQRLNLEIHALLHWWGDLNHKKIAKIVLQNEN